MKLICPECRRENEPERVYCHECGARLDRSVLAKVQPATKDPLEEQRRLKTMFDPNRGMLRRRLLQIGRLIVGALALAILVQILRTPDLPEASQEIGLGSQINLDLENAASEPQAAPLQYSEKAVNDYLAYVLKGKKKTLSNYLDFGRAVVALEEGFCDLAVERSLFGFPVVTSIGFAPRIENDNVAARVVERQDRADADPSRFNELWRISVR